MQVLVSRNQPPISRETNSPVIRECSRVIFLELLIISSLMFCSNLGSMTLNDETTLNRWFTNIFYTQTEPMHTDLYIVKLTALCDYHIILTEYK